MFCAAERTNKKLKLFDVYTVSGRSAISVIKPLKYGGRAESMSW